VPAIGGLVRGRGWRVVADGGAGCRGSGGGGGPWGAVYHPDGKLVGRIARVEGSLVEVEYFEGYGRTSYLARASATMLLQAVITEKLARRPLGTPGVQLHPLSSGWESALRLSKQYPGPIYSSNTPFRRELFSQE
jgi:hypothetical protein